jgi:FkbM family methyltransferase
MGPRSSLSKAILRRLPRLLPAIQAEAADPADLYFAYRLLLGRPGDPEGLRHWLQRLGGGMTRQQLVSSFLATPEFQRRHRLRDRTLVRADGFAIFVDRGEQGMSPAILGGGYEPHMTAALRRELTPDSVLLDVGCSIGWFTLLGASLAPAGKVIGIEPNGGNLELLYRSVAANGFRNVVILPYAATDERKLLQLGHEASAGFVHAVDEASDEPIVQGAPIDELVKDEPRIDVVKLDIEGHEPIALRGMQGTIARHRPLLLTELHPKLMRDHAGCDAGEYVDELLALSYSVSVLDADGTEVPAGSAAEVLSVWRSVNERCGTGDTTHMDLVARPLTGRCQ